MLSSFSIHMQHIKGYFIITFSGCYYLLPNLLDPIPRATNYVCDFDENRNVESKTLMGSGNSSFSFW